MSRVLVTGGVGTVGSAVVRRLLADPAYDVRVADRKPAPQWMREACEIRAAELSDVERAVSAMDGCAYVIHLASPAADTQAGDFSLIAATAALDSALLSAAIRHQIERFVYVSCASAFGPTGESATGGSQPRGHPTPASATGFAKLLGERLCQAAEVEHGLSSAICRAASTPPTAVDELAVEIVAAMSQPVG